MSAPNKYVETTTVEYVLKFRLVNLETGEIEIQTHILSTVEQARSMADIWCTKDEDGYRSKFYATSNFSLVRRITKIEPLMIAENGEMF